MEQPAPRRASAPLRGLVAVGLVAAVATAITGVAGGHVDLRADPHLRILQPADGATVGDRFTLRWTPGSHAGSTFAVIVDGVVPAPGSAMTAGPSAVMGEADQLATAQGNALMLSLAPRTGGSPDARRVHEIVVVPVGADGRRRGEDVAVVHVKTRG